MRGSVVVLTMLIAMVLSADGCALLLLDVRAGDAGAPRGGATADDRGGKSPEQVAIDYFAGWERGDLSGMERLVADPPDDFVRRHEDFATALRESSVRFAPGRVVRRANSAHVDFTVTRELTGVGTWSYGSTLELARPGRNWLVVWSPATLHPKLGAGGFVKLTRRGGTGGERLVDRTGRPLPAGTTARPYLDELAKRFVEPGTDRPGWVIEAANGTRSERLKTFPGRRANRTRTTLDRRLQAAADRAVTAMSEPAAIVAVRPSTGEILAVADRLDAGRAAFLGRYPPGSAFKVVTAAALLADGMSATTSVDCPGVAHVGERTIRGVNLGRTSLRRAFADSCNTTFARLAADRVGADRLAATARAFGFGGPLAPGVPAARGEFPVPDGTTELAEAAFGQGRVQASPLSMALVAAAAANGTWRPPRLVAARLIAERGDPVQPRHAIAHAAALRSMMRAVVTDGTAARAGLPSGVSGKTGTAEYGSADAGAHAWFIGFTGDLAFAVLVPGGGSGANAAAPLAARFLRGGR
ncbi:MAG TPA: penicillin-binding transpeptidase domain-containing protein [Streptosporangiaceae bacterium]|jgi:hypothetical protein|nr:penicillin-binding transpeptidase domain-containing protein [Streptosporangiaceae bacterium]